MITEGYPVAKNVRFSQADHFDGKTAESFATSTWRDEQGLLVDMVIDCGTELNTSPAPETRGSRFERLVAPNVLLEGCVIDEFTRGVHPE